MATLECVLQTFPPHKYLHTYGWMWLRSWRTLCGSQQVHVAPQVEPMWQTLDYLVSPLQRASEPFMCFGPCWFWSLLAPVCWWCGPALCSVTHFSFFFFNVTAGIRPPAWYQDHLKALLCLVRTTSWRDPYCSIGLSHHWELQIQLILPLKFLLLAPKEKIEKHETGLSSSSLGKLTLELFKVPLSEPASALTLPC